MTDNALVVYENPDAIRQEVQSLRATVEDVLPSRVDPDRFLRVVTKAVLENPRLIQATRVSILAAIHESAQLGLEPSGLLGSAYLVPYRRKVQGDGGKWTWITEAKLIPGYRGLIDLARRSGEIDAIWANVVRARDVFRLVQGSTPGIVHEPFIPDPSQELDDRDPGPYVGAYMVARLRGGVQQIEWMTTDQIEDVRRRSKAADDGPWITDWPEMARKTVVRRGSKYLPMTTEFRRALELDEEAERHAEPVTPEPVRMTTAQRILAERAQDPLDRPQDAPGPEQDVEPTQDPGDDQDGGPGASDAVCGHVPDPNPLGIEHPCTLDPGHKGPHQSEDGSWPSK